MYYMYFVELNETRQKWAMLQENYDDDDEKKNEH